MPAHETTFPTDKTRCDSWLAWERERERVNLGIVTFGAAACSPMPFNQTLSYQRYNVIMWMAIIYCVNRRRREIYISKLGLSTCKKKESGIRFRRSKAESGLESLRGWKGVLIRETNIVRMESRYVFHSISYREDIGVGAQVFPNVNFGRRPEGGNVIRRGASSDVRTGGFTSHLFKRSLSRWSVYTCS